MYTDAFLQGCNKSLLVPYRQQRGSTGTLLRPLSLSLSLVFLRRGSTCCCCFRGPPGLARVWGEGPMRGRHVTPREAEVSGLWTAGGGGGEGRR